MGLLRKPNVCNMFMELAQWPNSHRPSLRSSRFLAERAKKGAPRPLIDADGTHLKQQEIKKSQGRPGPAEHGGPKQGTADQTREPAD